MEELLEVHTLVDYDVSNKNLYKNRNNDEDDDDIDSYKNNHTQITIK